MWSCLLLLASLPQAGAVAEQASPAAPAPVETTVELLLHMRWSGVESWLVDGKDSAVLAALKMLDERLLELPNELPDWEAPPGTLELVLRVLAGAGSVSIVRSDAPIEGMPMPLAGELRVEDGDGGSGAVLAEDVAAFLEGLGAPIEEPDAGKDWRLPFPVPVWWGSDESAARLRFGLEAGAAAPELSPLLATGATVAASGYLDYGAVLRMLSGQIEGGDPELSAMMDVFDGMNLGDIRLEWATGTDAERNFFVANMPGWAESARESGMLGEADLGLDALALIPGDATWAAVSSMNPMGVLEMYREMLGSGMMGPSIDIDSMFSEATGLDLEADVVAPLGDAVVAYASDTTGGGGMFSTVVLLELADRARFLESWGRVEGFVNGMGRGFAKGYVGFRHVQRDSLDIGLLSFPGLPVPVELSFTTTETHAVWALSPQAVLAAVEQLRRGQEGSLLANPKFREQLPVDAATGSTDFEGATTVTWINTPRLMQDGYWAINSACAALANAVRSPSGLEREPGVLLPSFHELRAGAKGMVSVGRVVGPDFRTEIRGDRSALVNGAGFAGYIANSPLQFVLVTGLFVGTGLFLGAAVPSVLNELEDAQAYEASATDEALAQEMFEEMAAIELALQRYARDHDGRYPSTVDELFAPGPDGATYINEGLLTDPWGDPYLLVPPDVEGAAPSVVYQE